MGRPASMSIKRQPDRKANKPGLFRTRKDGKWWNYQAWSKAEALKLFQDEQAALAKEQAAKWETARQRLADAGQKAYADAIQDLIKTAPSCPLMNCQDWSGLPDVVAQHPEMSPDRLAFWLSENVHVLPKQVVQAQPQTVNGGTAVEGGTTVNAAMVRFLERQRMQVNKGEISSGRYEVIDRCIRHFVQFAGANASVKRMEKGDLLEAYSAHLSDLVFAKKEWSGAYADGYMVVARQFTHWAYKVELIDREPRNLHDADLAIPKPPRQITPFTIPEVHSILDAANERMKLACLLMLNCGYTQQDLSDLQPSEVDWDKGLITRKRSKTEDKGSVPTVQYPLWQETFTLLKKYGQREGGNVLLNRDGKTILTNELVQNKKGEWHNKKVDNLAVNFRRLAAKLVKDKKVAKGKSLKHFRKTSNSALANNKDFAHYAEYFLGQAGKTINTAHYTEYDTKSFGDAVAWLHDFYFAEKPVSKTTKPAKTKTTKKAVASSSKG